MMARIALLMLGVGLAVAQEMPAGITRVAGVDANSGLAYALVATEGKGVGATAPRLIAQCSKGPEGKLKFELMTDEPGFAGSGELKFLAPWRTGKGELFAPPVAKVQVTMEFLGYVKVKPVKRQWEYPPGTTGLMRYATPGMKSSNMEDARDAMLYLRSLPTLRLTVPGHGMMEFETAKWQAAVKGEALCGASGL